MRVALAPLRSVPRALALSAVALVALGSCRTRLWQLTSPDDGGAPPADAAAPRDQFVGPDLAHPVDLHLPPDFAPPADLIVPPDFLPPPDLTRPHFCNGIFVFEENSRFSFFDPMSLTFHDIATLVCDAQFSPFSMGVSKDGVAWVEYSDPTNRAPSRLYNVDTTTGACAPTAFRNSGGSFSEFGMGFAADGPGAPTETLYLAGDQFFTGAAPMLGSLDLTTFAIQPIGTLPGRAELTGNGDGELWAFFADTFTQVGRVDKLTGNLNPVYPLPQLGDLSQSAFAFAAFAGDLYAFVAPNGTTTSVYRTHAADGTTALVLAGTGRTVVGAGVSTCAPSFSFDR